MSKSKKNKMTTKILAIILSILMIVSMAFYTIYMIVESFKTQEEDPNTNTETTETIVSYEIL